MSRHVSVDTNILIEYLYERDARANRFFHATIDCAYTIVISHHTLAELGRHHGDPTALLAVLAMFEKVLQITVEGEDTAVAQTLPTHAADALHAAIALRLNVPLLTKNTKDFAIPGLTLWTYDDII